MELSWSTFFLEILNFLILVWILNRFLYRPVLNIINQRRSGIEKELEESRKQKEEANALREQYEHRLTDWETEQRKARDELDQEIDKIRATKMSGLDADLKKEREKNEVLEKRQLQEAVGKIEETAMMQAARFASGLLNEGAGPELEARLVDMALKEMAAMTEERVQSLRSVWVEEPTEINIESAYPLESAQQESLKKQLHGITGLTVPVKFSQKTELIAGLKITVGPWILHLNLQDEMKSFAEFAHGRR